MHLYITVLYLLVSSLYIKHSLTLLLVLSLGAIHSLEKAAKIFKNATLSDIELWKEEKR